MKNKLTALDKIYELLLKGGEFGYYMDPPKESAFQQPIWNAVLWKDDYVFRLLEGREPKYDLLHVNRYGHSAKRFSKKSIREELKDCFKCKPSVFLTAYQCRFG